MRKRNSRSKTGGEEEKEQKRGGRRSMRKWRKVEEEVNVKKVESGR